MKTVTHKIQPVTDIRNITLNHWTSPYFCNGLIGWVFTLNYFIDSGEAERTGRDYGWDARFYAIETLGM